MKHAHTHNTHIWSIQFLLPISEDKYDGCKLHTVKLVFYTVYMRWVSTLVNYSADYSELPFINEGCGCLVGLIHESSPPSRVISRLCGCSTFFSANMWGRLWHFHFEFIITLLKITSVNFPWQIFFKWHRQGPLKKKKKKNGPHTGRATCRGLLGASVPVTLHASHYMSHLPARTPILGYCPRWRRHACCCWRLCWYCYWHPSSVQKKKKKKPFRDGFAFCLIK